MQYCNRPPRGKIKFDFVFMGVCLFLLTSIFNTSQFGASLSWVLVPSAVILAGGFLAPGRRILPGTLMIFLFYAVFCVSTVLSPYVEIQRDLITFGILCMVYVLAASYEYSTDQLRFLLNLYVATALIVCAVILYCWVTGDYYVAWFQRSSFKFFGVYKDPNYTMAYVIPAIMILLCKTIVRKKKLVNILLLLVMFAAVIATGSRSALVSLAIAVLAALLFINISPLTRIKIFASVLLLSIVALVVLLTALPEHVRVRLFSLDGSGRMELWMASLKVFEELPLLGGGMGAASQLSISEIGNNSHNVYIDILCNSGIIGSALFIGFFVKNCCLSQKQNRFFLYGFVIAGMLPLFFINGFNTTTFYLPLILLTILSNFCKNAESDVSVIL